MENSIIVGHGRDYVSYRSDLDDDLPEPPDNLSTDEYEQWYEDVAYQYSDEYPTSQAKDAAAYAMKLIQKNVPDIIAKNKGIFQSMNDVKMIHIYGFSFADVDLPYLMEVANNVDMKTVKLEISYYTDNDKIKAKAFLDNLDPVPKEVSFIKLDEILRFKQLTIF